MLPHAIHTHFVNQSSHLQDLKEITHDFLYENYRTEKLSRTVNGGDQEDASLNAEDMASQSVRLKEEQLRKEEEKVSIIQSCTTQMYLDFFGDSFVKLN